MVVLGFGERYSDEKTDHQASPDLDIVKKRGHLRAGQVGKAGTQSVPSNVPDRFSLHRAGPESLVQKWSAPALIYNRSCV